jgi:hypothetical protein
VKRLAGASQVTDPTPGSEDRRRHARCSWDVLIDHDGRRLDLGDPFETEERWAAG